MTKLRACLKLLLPLALTLGCTLPGFAAPAEMPLMATIPAAKPIYTVTGIRGHLYYDDSGTFDPRDLVKVEAGMLHNTVIGEGIAKGPSNTTLLLVEVSGPSFAIKDVGTLMLKVVTERYDEHGKPYKVTLLDSKLDLNLYFQDTAKKILVPFLLYETGSGPITITATLAGGKDANHLSSSLTKQILFGGGE